MKGKDETMIHGEQSIIGNEAQVTHPACAREGELEESASGLFAPEVFTRIFERIIEGESLIRICAEPSMPSRKTFYLRISQDSELRESYERAKVLSADYLAEEILEIADTCRMGTKTVNKNGKIETVVGDMVERARLQIETRKWQAAKLAPKKYGDRLQTDMTVQVETHEQRLERLMGGKAAEAKE